MNKPPPEAKPTPTIEEYLESILNMISEGKAVHAARLAERLNVAPPTVTATLRRMKRDGLVNTNQRKEVALTERGMSLAKTIVRRHRLVERLLTDSLGVAWYAAHEEACLLEHGISSQVEERLYLTLGKPSSCPHGNPIPEDGAMPPLKGVPLDSVTKGQRVKVERVSEEAERNPELMKYFQRGGIMPGALLTVQDVAAYAGTITVAAEHGQLSIGLKAAGMIWVTPARTAKSS